MAEDAQYQQPLPTNPDDFGQDDRISFSRLDNKHIAVLDDGQEMEFDTDLRRWFHTIDEALIEQQQQGYVMAIAEQDRENGKGNGNGNGNDNGNGIKRKAGGEVSERHTRRLSSSFM